VDLLTARHTGGIRATPGCNEWLPTDMSEQYNNVGTFFANSGKLAMHLPKNEEKAT
jgi:hypothetical protein